MRYLGFSDHPAWACARAHTIAELRGWTPLAAIQIEWSLLQRSVEHELVAMAGELGLGVCPWGGLRGGVLSGKFRRGGVRPAEATRVQPESRHLHEGTYALLDAMESIAAAHDCSIAAVALSWLRGRPGCTSIILGARTETQLRENLASLEVELSPDERRSLDERTMPAEHFPQTFLNLARTTMLNGTTIEGVTAPVWELSPASDRERA